MKRIIRIFVILCCLGLTACQQSPQNDIVVQKQDAFLQTQEDYLLSDTLSLVPTHWNTEAMLLADGKVEIIFHASVEYPSVDRIAIPEVAAEAIDVHVLESLLTLFRDGVRIKLNPQAGDFSAVQTKQEIEQEMYEVTSQLEELDLLSPAADGNMEEIENARTALIDRFLMLQEAYKTAPDESEVQYPSYEELNALPSVQTELLDAVGETFGEMYIQTCGGDGEDKRQSQFYLSADRGKAISEEPIRTIVDALHIGEALLSQLGLSEQYAVVSANEGPFGFGINFGRVYKGLSYSPLVNAEIQRDRDFNLTWRDERLELILDRETEFSEGRALRAASWYGNSRIVSDIVDNVQLIPFAELQEHALQSFKNQFAWLPGDVHSRRVEIMRVSLGYKRIAMKGTRNRYIMIPVWTFQGSIMDCIYLEDGTIAAPHAATFPEQVILILSALDGSILYYYNES